MAEKNANNKSVQINELCNNQLKDNGLLNAVIWSMASYDNVNDDDDERQQQKKKTTEKMSEYYVACAIRIHVTSILRIYL